MKSGLQANEVHLLRCPANAPDLNNTENVWRAVEWKEYAKQG